MEISQIPKAKGLIEAAELRSTKIVSASKALQAQAKTGLSSKLDGSIQMHIVAFKKTLKEINSERAPLTKKMDELKKLFTTKENNIKAEITSLQKIRDVFAKGQAEKANKAKREAEQARVKENEVVTLEAGIKLDLTMYVQSAIDRHKKAMIKALKDVTDENMEEKKSNLICMKTAMHSKIWDAFSNQGKSLYDNDVDAIVTKVKSEMFENLSTHYSTEINDYKQECMHVIKMGSKELIEKKEADISINSAAAVEVAEVQIQTDKDAKQADIAFNSVTVQEEIPDARQGFKIQVKNHKDYARVIAFWTQKQLGEMDFDKIANKKVSSMILDLEKLAHKEGVKVEGLNYEVVYRAVNKAS